MMFSTRVKRARSMNTRIAKSVSFVMAEPAVRKRLNTKKPMRP